MTASATVNAHPLRADERPDFEGGDDKVRLADLFCGCGGLSLGVAQAAENAGRGFEVVLAVDSDADALAVYEANFPKAATHPDNIEDLLDGEIGTKATKTERALVRRVGDVTACVGGPPCQGHSDLNNVTRRVDPKNALYLRMVRFAELVRPAVVLIENVPAVQHSNPDVVGTARGALLALGYSVDDRVISMELLGVAQRRRRHLMLAVDRERGTAESVLGAVETADLTKRDLRWAIGDLASIVNGKGIDKAPKASTENQERMDWMLSEGEYDLPNERRPKCHQNDDHSYRSMYGRLSWDAPAQTITSGYGSIGQGRYMHPELARALTPHEAARIQGFPDYFDFTATSLRAPLANMIGNAVPPQLGAALFAELLTLDII